ncbi:MULTISPECIES: hypothetical protein [Streptomyces]|uniref:Uncharacterized protein n=2 Tax=Streptomyces TaxID=1883 RepID=A0ABU4KIX5_9ACTN|nr:hypothetical protein [Streptomyces roseolus]MDX2297743.1 hypothetical protein [Streptomyces roseolus]
MPDTAGATTALTGIAAAAQQGPGDTLRIVLLVSMVGGALLAWFLLRGYGAGETTDATPAPDRTSTEAADQTSAEASEATDRTSPGTTAGTTAETADRSAGTPARGASGDAEDANA